MYSSRNIKVRTNSSTGLCSSEKRKMTTHSSSDGRHASHKRYHTVSQGKVDGEESNDMIRSRRNSKSHFSGQAVKTISGRGNCRASHLSTVGHTENTGLVQSDNISQDDNGWDYHMEDSFVNTDKGEGSRKINCQVMEGNIAGSKDSGFAQDDGISPTDGSGSENYEKATLSTTKDSHCRETYREVVKGDIRSNKDSNVVENDSISEESNSVEGIADVTIMNSVGFENDTQIASSDFQFELSEMFGRKDDALKDELLHICEREQTTLEWFFKSKMEELLRRFRTRQLDWEETSRAERAKLENNMAVEKAEMQKKFTEEIAKLTRAFNEERRQLEEYYKTQLKDLKEQVGTEQRQLNEKFARETVELKSNLEAEYQVIFKMERAEGRQEALREKSEMEALWNKEKMELERKYQLLLVENGANIQKLKAEFETKSTQEKVRIETECQEKIREIETKITDETSLRVDTERELQREKKKSAETESLSKEENDKLRKELEKIRRELDEKNRYVLEMKQFEETVTLKGHEGLRGKLKDDFDKLLAAHKMKLDKSLRREKESLDQTSNTERLKMTQELQREKQKLTMDHDEAIRNMERRHVEEKIKLEEKVHQYERKENEWLSASLSVHHVEHQSGTLADHSAVVSNGRGLSRLPEQHQNEMGMGIERFPLRIDHGKMSSKETTPNDQYEGELNTDKDSPTGEHLRQEGAFVYRRHEPVKQDLPGGTSSNMSGSANLYTVTLDNGNVLRFEIKSLKSENDGLKAKIEALKENIELHKRYKEEAKAEMTTLQKMNREKEEKIQELSREIEAHKIRRDQEALNVKVSGSCQVKVLEGEENTGQHRATTEEKKSRVLELEVRGVRAEKTVKAKDTDTERRREKECVGLINTRQSVDVENHGNSRGYKNASDYEKKPQWKIEPRNHDHLKLHGESHKAKYEASSLENHQLLQTVEYLKRKLNSLEDRQTQILHRHSQRNSYAETTGETQRLKLLVSENSSLKARTTELQHQLQQLLEKLRDEKKKAASLQTVLSSEKSRNFDNIHHLQQRLVNTGEELSGSRGELDPDALRRIEKEIINIGQIIKTQYGEGSRAQIALRTEDWARLKHLEKEKQELEIKLEMARNAMNEYVSHLNDKMHDVESMTGMSKEMIQELHKRNNNLRQTLLALEEGQKKSHIQNEQLRQQKSELQDLIGNLCREGTGGQKSYDLSTTSVYQDNIIDSYDGSLSSDYRMRGFDTSLQGGYRYAAGYPTMPYSSVFDDHSTGYSRL